MIECKRIRRRRRGAQAGNDEINGEGWGFLPSVRRVVRRLYRDDGVKKGSGVRRVLGRVVVDDPRF